MYFFALDCMPSFDPILLLWGFGMFFYGVMLNDSTCSVAIMAKGVFLYLSSLVAGDAYRSKSASSV